MSADTVEMPDLIEAEDENTMFAPGHVDPQAVRIAVALHTFNEWGISRAEAFDGAITCTVAHEWWKDDPQSGNDELMTRCEPGDEGAVAFTVVRGLLP